MLNKKERDELKKELRRHRGNKRFFENELKRIKKECFTIYHKEENKLFILMNNLIHLENNLYTTKENKEHYEIHRNNLETSKKLIKEYTIRANQ